MNVLVDEDGMTVPMVLDRLESLINRYSNEMVFIYIPNPFGPTDEPLMDVVVENDAFTDGLGADTDKLRAVRFEMHAVETDGAVTVKVIRQR